MSKKSTTCTVDGKDFAADAMWISRSIPKSRSMPMFSTVQVTAEAGTLTLRRTDLDIFAEAVLAGTGDASSSVLVAATSLATALKGARGDVIADVGDGVLRLVINGRISTIAAASVDASDFPAFPDITPSGEPAVLGTALLARAMASVGNDSTLPMLTGVLFDGGTMASTDRFRLSRVVYDDEGFKALVPAEALRPFAGSQEKVVYVGHAEDSTGKAPWVLLSWAGRSITARTLDCEFPKWRQLIPSDDSLTAHVMLRRDDLLDALSHCGESSDVTFTVPVKDGPLRVQVADRAGDVQVDQQVSATVLHTDGVETMIRFNTQNLLGCLKNIPGQTVRFGITTPARGAVWRGASEVDLHLVMPLRIAG